MNFNIIEDFHLYNNSKTFPENIIPIITYMYKYHTQQLTLLKCLNIITDWSYDNDTSTIVNNDELNHVFQYIIDDSHFIVGLRVMLIIFNNILHDNRILFVKNFDNLITRINYCNPNTQTEWVHLLLIYSQYYFSENVLQCMCEYITNYKYICPQLYCRIIYNHFKLEPLKTVKMLQKNNVITRLYLNYVNTSSNNDMKYITQMYSEFIKNNLPCTIPEAFYSQLYSKQKLYKFLSKMLYYNFDYFKYEQVIRIYTDKLLVKSKPISYYEIVFLTLIHEKFKLIYNYRIGIHLSKIFKYINYNYCDDNTMLTYFTLLRNIYNSDKTLYTKYFIKKVLTHSNSNHFCENLKELAYRTCLINKVRVDKFFNPF